MANLYLHLSEQVASSIHTIYRPVARSRKSVPSSPASLFQLAPSSLLTHLDATDSPEEDGDTSEGDAALTDFEVPTPRVESAKSGFLTRMHPSPEQANFSPMQSPSRSSTARGNYTRQGSMATVRVQRRAKLAEKLKEVFELDGIEEVWAEMPCWILRSIRKPSQLP